MHEDFAWDPKKAEMNKRKHEVGFAEGSTIFDDPRSLTVEEQDVDGEERGITVGIFDTGRLLVVAYVYRGGKIRIISARKADQYERAQYEG